MPRVSGVARIFFVAAFLALIAQGPTFSGSTDQAAQTGTAIVTGGVCTTCGITNTNKAVDKTVEVSADGKTTVKEDEKSPCRSGNEGTKEWVDNGCDTKKGTTTARGSGGTEDVSLQCADGEQCGPVTHGSGGLFNPDTVKQYASDGRPVISQTPITPPSAEGQRIMDDAFPGASQGNTPLSHPIMPPVQTPTSQTNPISPIPGTTLDYSNPPLVGLNHDLSSHAALTPPSQQPSLPAPAAYLPITGGATLASYEQLSTRISSTNPTWDWNAPLGGIDQPIGTISTKDVFSVISPEDTTPTSPSIFETASRYVSRAFEGLTNAFFPPAAADPSRIVDVGGIQLSMEGAAAHNSPVTSITVYDAAGNMLSTRDLQNAPSVESAAQTIRDNPDVFFSSRDGGRYEGYIEMNTPEGRVVYDPGLQGIAHTDSEGSGFPTQHSNIDPSTPNHGGDTSAKDTPTENAASDLRPTETNPGASVNEVSSWQAEGGSATTQAQGNTYATLPNNMQKTTETSREDTRTPTLPDEVAQEAPARFSGYIPPQSAEQSANLAPDSDQQSVWGRVLSNFPDIVPTWAQPTSPPVRATLEGQASCYDPTHTTSCGGTKHEGGMKTASGQPYTGNNEPTAALQLKLAERYTCGYAGKTCLARITALDTGNQITARINDNGPLFQGKIIDLSSKARDMLASGDNPRVRVEILGNTSAASAERGAPKQKSGGQKLQAVSYCIGTSGCTIDENAYINSLCQPDTGCIAQKLGGAPDTEYPTEKPILDTAERAQEFARQIQNAGKNSTGDKLVDIDNCQYAGKGACLQIIDEIVRWNATNQSRTIIPMIKNPMLIAERLGAQEAAQLFTQAARMGGGGIIEPGAGTVAENDTFRKKIGFANAPLLFTTTPAQSSMLEQAIRLRSALNIGTSISSATEGGIGYRDGHAGLPIVFGAPETGADVRRNSVLGVREGGIVYRVGADADTKVGTIQQVTPSGISLASLPSRFVGAERFSGINPVIARSMTEASKLLPPGYTAKVISASRVSSTVGSASFHLKRDGANNSLAVDVTLVSPSGEELKNIRAPQNFSLYREFMQNVKAAQDQLYPNLRGFGRWGGYFVSGIAQDLMHYDLGPKDKTVAGTWENGLRSQYAYYGMPRDVGKGMGPITEYKIPALVQPENYDGFKNVDGTITAKLGAIQTIGDIRARVVEENGKLDIALEYTPPILSDTEGASSLAKNAPLGTSGPLGQQGYGAMQPWNAMQPAGVAPRPRISGSIPAAQNMQGVGTGGVGVGIVNPLTTGGTEANGTSSERFSCAPATMVNNSTTTPLILTWACPAGTRSVGYGFSTLGTHVGTTTLIISTTSPTIRYELECLGAQTPRRLSCTARVAHPKVTLIARPANVHAGESTELRWNANEVATCELFAPNGTRIMRGGTTGEATTLPLSDTTTFTATCATTGGDTVSTRATVSVTQ